MSTQSQEEMIEEAKQKLLEPTVTDGEIERTKKIISVLREDE